MKKNNVPLMVLNQRPAIDTNKLTERDVERILTSPVGIMYTDKYMKKIQEEATKLAMDSVIETFKVKLQRAEDFIGTCGIMTNLYCIEKVFEEAQKETNRKGWQRSHLSIKEIIPKLVEAMSNTDYTDYLNKENLPKYCKYLKEEYNLDFETESYDVNKELGLTDFNPYQDESCFDNMTSWDIYDEASEGTESLMRALYTVCMVKYFRETGKGTYTIAKSVERINELIKEYTTRENGIMDLKKDADAFGIELSEAHINAIRKASFRPEWRKDY